MPDVSLFLRGLSGQKLLCCEPVILWLQACGMRLPAAVDVSREALQAAWDARGTEAGIAGFAGLFGLAETAAPERGDAVLVRLPDASPALALALGEGFCGGLLDDGRIVMARLPVLRAWRIDAARG